MKPSGGCKLKFKPLMIGAVTRVSLLAIFAFLSACAPPPPPTTESAEALKVGGVLLLRAKGQKARRLRMVWERTNGHAATWHDEVEIKNPLGNTVMRIAVNHNGAVLRQANGKIIRADSGEELALKMFGIALPVRAFGYWIQGKAAPFLPSRTNDRGDLIQDGWTINYIAWDAKNRVKTAHLQTAEVQVKIRIDKWFE